MSNHNKLEIEKVFAEMLRGCVACDFKNHVLEYKKILLEEEEFLENTYLISYFSKDHPLSCAKALQQCWLEFAKRQYNQVNSFPESLANFKVLATNSQFYPKTQLLGLLIVNSLIIFSTVFLVGMLIAYPFIPATVLLVAGAIAVVCLFPNNSILVGLFGSNHIKPIQASEKKGLAMFSFFHESEPMTVRNPFQPREFDISQLIM